MQLPNLLASRWGRLIAFFFLYVTEGIPLGFTSTAIATQLRRSGVGVEEIGYFIGWLYFPWAWKWVIGPVVDLFYSKRLGPRRGWIIGTQVMMVLTLMFCAPLELNSDNLSLLTSIILIHNVFCATQDVAIDALACSTLHEDERGLANGLMFAGQTLGIPLGGACVLYLLAGVDWLPMLQDGIPMQQTYYFVAGCIFAVTLFIAIPMREASLPRATVDDERLRELRGDLASYQVEMSERYRGEVGSIRSSIRSFAASMLARLLPRAARSPRDILRVELVDYVLTAVRSFFSSRAALAALILALLPAGAVALNLALQKTLAVEIGMSDTEIADLEIVSSIAWALSCVFGGFISDRVGHLKSLAVFLVLMSVPTVWLGVKLAEFGLIMPVETTQSADANDSDNPPVSSSVATSAADEKAASEKAASETAAAEMPATEKPADENAADDKAAPTDEVAGSASDAGPTNVEPVDDAASTPEKHPVRTEHEQKVFLAFWWAVMFYMVAQGLMYGTRAAIFMRVSNPAVAATQFTAYMSMMNLVIAYSAWWQGLAIARWGYPTTLFIDAATGLLGLVLLPLIYQDVRKGDGTSSIAD